MYTEYNLSIKSDVRAINDMRNMMSSDKLFDRINFTDSIINSTDDEAKKMITDLREEHYKLIQCKHSYIGQSSKNVIFANKKKYDASLTSMVMDVSKIRTSVNNKLTAIIDKYSDTEIKSNKCILCIITDY